MDATCPPLIVEALYSFRTGGSEKLGLLLAAEFRKRGFRACVVSVYDDTGPIKVQLDAMGIPATGFGFEGRSRWRRFLLSRDITRFLRREGPAAVHVHHGLCAIRFMGPVRAAAVPRVVFTEHSIQAFKDMPAYRQDTARAARQADVITAVSEDIKAYLATEMQLDRGALRLIPNAVSPEFHTLARNAQLRSARGLAGSFVIGYVGRLHPDKDLGTLIDALEIVRRSDRTVRLVLAGAGAELESLRAHAARAGIAGDVVFWGEVESAHELLSVADAFAMSSVREGLPMALMEAMAAGLPVISTAVGGIPQLLDGANGILVPPRSPDLLAKAILRLRADPAGAAKMGALARETIAARYGVDAAVDAYLEAFGLPRSWPAGATVPP